MFYSSQIPGEIIDLMVVNTATLKDNPKLGKALVGAWYETMALMSQDTSRQSRPQRHGASASGTDLAGFDSQLKTTRMFYKPSDAVASPRPPTGRDHEARAQILASPMACSARVRADRTSSASISPAGT